MKGERGLTLIELAIVLIVLGILLGIGAGIVGVLVKRVKYNESREIVNAAVEGIVGYVISAGKLPDNTTWTNYVRSSKDSYGKDLAYIYSNNLTADNSICTQTSTNITVKVCPDATCSSPSQTVNNVAFLIVSGDGNYNNQTGGTQGVGSNTTIMVYEYGLQVDNYAGDVNRAEPYDDIVKWVTLYELKPKAGCVGSGGGGGGGGSSCTTGSPINLVNIGGNRSIGLGTQALTSCNPSSCQSFNSGNSVIVSSSNCVVIYKGSSCNNFEATYTYSDIKNADANNDCVVNYNNGRLQDN